MNNDSLLCRCHFLSMLWHVPNIFSPWHRIVSFAFTSQVITKCVSLRLDRIVYQCINSKNNFLGRIKMSQSLLSCPDFRQLLRDLRLSLIYICGKSPWKRLDHRINYSQSIALWKCWRWWICGYCVAVLWCDHGFVSVIDMNIFQSFKSQTTVQPPSNINSFVSGTMCPLRFSLF